MLSVQKSLRLALVAAIALIASAAETQAATRFVFGKEPIARHNRAVAARRTQAASGYRVSSSNRTTPSTQSYGGTAMVQTYPLPQQRSYVTPVAGVRPQMAANNGQVVR